MSNAVASHLTEIALRAVLNEIGAHEALARLLGAPAPRSPAGDLAADIGRQVLAAGAGGGSQEEVERPVRARKAKGRKAYKIQNGNSKKKQAKAEGEAVDLVNRLVEAHNGINPAAKSIETSPALFRRWMGGAPLKDASLDRLREAVQALDVEVSKVGVPGEVAPTEQTEGAALLVRLEEKHGSRGLVAERLGLTPEALERIAAGGVVGQTTLGRLRTGLANPPQTRAQEEARPETSFRRSGS